MRVFATSDDATLPRSRAINSALARARARLTMRAAQFTARKNFAAEAARGASDSLATAQKRANQCNQFAPRPARTTRSATARELATSPRIEIPVCVCDCTDSARRFFRAPKSGEADAQSADLLLQQIVDGLRVRLAARCLHRPGRRTSRSLSGSSCASATLSGFLATMSSTRPSIAETSVTCCKPRCSTSRARIAALVPDDLENVLGDLAGNGALRHQVEDGAELRVESPATANDPYLPC